jgi:hypothetical protein
MFCAGLLLSIADLLDFSNAIANHPPTGAHGQAQCISMFPEAFPLSSETKGDNPAAGAL